MGKQPGPSDFGWIEKRRDSSLLNPYSRSWLRTLRLMNRGEEAYSQS